RSLCCLHIFYIHYTPYTFTSPLSLHDALPISNLFSYLEPAINYFSSKKVHRRRPDKPADKNIFRIIIYFFWRSNLLNDTVFQDRSEEHTSELHSRFDIVCRLLLEKTNNSHTS